jgi:hypothetical protein
MNGNIHGLKDVETYVWPRAKYLNQIYVSFKLIELKHGGEITVFVDSLEELDKVIDALSVLRREFAVALEEDHNASLKVAADS